MNNELKTYLESGRMVEESKCKFYKRMLVGMIRYFEDHGSVHIPEEYFDDVPDDVGFDSKIDYIENGTDPVRTFTIKNDWKTTEDDCGGNSHAEDTVFFNMSGDGLSFEVDKRKRLKVVK